MKKILLTLGLAAILLSAKSQIVITGYLANPTGTDMGATPGTAYEYIQLMATEDIDFSTKNYSLVMASNATDNTPYASNPAQESWATAGQRTYKFNMTSGTVSKGQFFYVGGDGMKINGSASQSFPPEAKWIVARNYNIVVSDEFVGRVNDADHALKTNGGIPNSGRAFGIAVFNTTGVSATTVPIDVIFFREASTGVFWTAGLTPAEGYLICNNDHYQISESPYFMGDDKNTFAFPHTTKTETSSWFMALGGDYDSDLKTWKTPRSLTRVLLTNSSVLAAIESGAGITTLPVSLTTFTAKANKAGTVNLAWSTASEKDNAYFEVTRSTDGVNFNKIGQVAGNGTSNATNNYSYTDSKPVNGTNYYRLTQVDNDGKSAQSKVASAKVSLSASSLTVSVASNRNAIKVNYDAAADGQATFTIYNTAGVKLASINQNVNAGANQITVPVALGNAVHVLKVSQGGVTSSVKF